MSWASRFPFRPDPSLRTDSTRFGLEHQGPGMSAVPISPADEEARLVTQTVVARAGPF